MLRDSTYLLKNKSWRCEKCQRSENLIFYLYFMLFSDFFKSFFSYQQVHIIVQSQQILVFSPLTKRSCMDHMVISKWNLQTSADKICIKSGIQNVFSVQIHRFCLKHFRGWTVPASIWSLLSSVFWLLVTFLLITIIRGYLLICRPCQLWSVVQPWQWVCIHLLW